MICDICYKKGTRIRLVTRNYGKGDDLLIVENIPLITCPHCGESYFTAKTLHEIERINYIVKVLLKNGKYLLQSLLKCIQWVGISSC